MRRAVTYRHGPARLYGDCGSRGVEAYAAGLAACGAAVTWDGELPGHCRFCSEGPVGNRLEFLEPTLRACGPGG